MIYITKLKGTSYPASVILKSVKIAALIESNPNIIKYPSTINKECFALINTLS